LRALSVFFLFLHLLASQSHHRETTKQSFCFVVRIRGVGLVGEIVLFSERNSNVGGREVVEGGKEIAMGESSLSQELEGAQRSKH